jgi:Zn-dependent peptidase ImmA (M78 family)
MTELPKTFRKRCEVISSDLRIELGLRVFEPLPANQLAKKCKVIVRRPDEMDMSQPVIDYFLQADNWWGVLFQFKQPVIVYDPKQSSARYESTIMHELAHLILKHPPERIYFAPDGPFTRDFDSVIETEAAYLGSCLQIPRRGLLWAVQNGMSDKEIAHYFGASLEMVHWRQNAVNSE